MSIRRLRETDYAEQFSLINEFRPTEFSEAEFQYRLTSLPGTQEIWVQEKDGRLLGTITLIQELKFIFNLCTFVHVEDVCVRKDARGSGIGSRLVRYAVDRAKEQGCKKITLVCNESVAPFQEANQFERRGLQQSQLLRSDP